MAHGIIVYDDRGNKILDSGKRLGRFVGWHDINPAPVGQFKYSWDHRNLLPMGRFLSGLIRAFGSIITAGAIAG